MFPIVLISENGLYVLIGIYGIIKSLPGCIPNSNDENGTLYFYEHVVDF